MALVDRKVWLPILGMGLLGSGDGIEAQEAGSLPAAVIGSVVDRTESRPLSHAVLRFFVLPVDDDTSSSEAQIAEAAVDAEGNFATGPLVVGTYRVEIRADGYQTMEERIGVDGGSIVDLQIEMVPEPVALDGIVVVSRRSRLLEDRGFYARRAQGLGRSFTRAEIEDLGYNRTTDVLQVVPGVTLRRASNQGSPYVFMRGGCRPDLIVDGLNLGSDIPVDDIMPADNLEGLEVHGTATLPLEFWGNPCGAVVMWTIDPSVQEENGPFSWKRILVPGGLVLGLFLVW